MRQQMSSLEKKKTTWYREMTLFDMRAKLTGNVIRIFVSKHTKITIVFWALCRSYSLWLVDRCSMFVWDKRFPPKFSDRSVEVSVPDMMLTDCVCLTNPLVLTLCCVWHNNLSCIHFKWISILYWVIRNYSVDTMPLFITVDHLNFRSQHGPQTIFAFVDSQTIRFGLPWCCNFMEAVITCLSASWIFIYQKSAVLRLTLDWDCYVWH